MGKKFDQQPGNSSGHPLGDKGMSREDRKNQQIALMFQKQERARLRKEERKTNQKEQRTSDFIKPVSGRSTGGHATLPHKPVPGRSNNFTSSTSRTLPGNTFPANHPSRTSGIPGFGALSATNQTVKSKEDGDFPPIKVIFAKNVEKTASNAYFFRRKDSFEKREIAKQQEIHERQMNLQVMKERMLQTVNSTDQNQVMRDAQMHHVMQQQHHYQQAQIAAQQGGGLSRAAVNQLAPQGFMTAGTGGMYDPIISGGDSSMSSASKNSGQQQANFNQLNAMNYIPRPNQLIAHSAPNHMRPIAPGIFGPSGSQQQSVNGNIQPPSRAFVAGSDSSEVEDSSDSRPAQKIQEQMNMPQIMISPAPPASVQHKQPIQSIQNAEESDDDNEEMKLILEKTREAQRKLKQQQTIDKK